MRCEERFNQIYGRDAEEMAFCPYRICPIGAHSDHNLGKITGLAIDKGIHIAYAPKHNGVVEMASLQFSKRAQWHITSVPLQKQEDWADYLRGATLALSKRQKLNVGPSSRLKIQMSSLTCILYSCPIFLKILLPVPTLKSY